MIIIASLHPSLLHSDAIVILSDFGSRRISRSSKRVKKKVVKQSEEREREKGCSPTHI